MKTKSFTLIEVVAVITIIALMASIIVYGIGEWKDDANLKKGIAYSNEIKSKIGDSLLAEWKMEEGTGSTIYDSGRIGNTGTINQGTNWITNCAEGKCLGFNSTRITLTNIGGVNFKTFGFWVKTDQSSANIMTKRSGNTEQSGGFDVYVQGGMPYLRAYTGNGISNTINSNEVINDNIWHFVCITLQNNTAYFIIDGEFKGSGNAGISDFGGTHTIYLGGIYSGGWTYGIFHMDDLMIFQDSIID